MNNSENNSGCLSLLIGAIIADFIIGWILMMLWNWLLVDLAKFPEITFWQGVGIVLLCNIIGNFFRKKNN